MADDDDEPLIRAVCCGGADAFATLVDRHGSVMIPGRGVVEPVDLHQVDLVAGPPAQRL